MYLEVDFVRRPSAQARQSPSASFRQQHSKTNIPYQTIEYNILHSFVLAGRASVRSASSYSRSLATTFAFLGLSHSLHPQTLISFRQPQPYAASLFLFSSYHSGQSTQYRWVSETLRRYVGRPPCHFARSWGRRRRFRGPRALRRTVMPEASNSQTRLYFKAQRTLCISLRWA